MAVDARRGDGTQDEISCPISGAHHRSRGIHGKRINKQGWIKGRRKRWERKHAHKRPQPDGESVRRRPRQQPTLEVIAECDV
jgi:hypothetical protein